MEDGAGWLVLCPTAPRPQGLSSELSHLSNFCFRKTTPSTFLPACPSASEAGGHFWWLKTAWEDSPAVGEGDSGLLHNLARKA